MKKYIYYHLYLPNEHAAWSNYLLEQYKTCEDSGLIDEIESFNLVMVGKKDNINLCVDLAHTISSKIKMYAFEDKFKSDSDLHTLDTDLRGKNERPMTEYGTLCLIADHARQERAQFLYMHAKGVTAYERCLRAKRFNEFKNYFYWRKFLEWGTIENWKICIEKLNSGYDVVGCNYTEWPMKHFSGNYWWSHSDYIRRIEHINDDVWWAREEKENPSVQNQTWRLRDEMWICHSKDVKVYSLKNAENPPPKSNLATDFMPRKKYEGQIKTY